MATKKIGRRVDGRNPQTWGPNEWAKAFAYFHRFYGADGIYADFFDGQPVVTMEEFQTAILADYTAATSNEAEHPLFDSPSFWEWASVERERVRDRVLVARGHKPIGYWPDGQGPQGWPQAAVAVA
jgi:hypothetical protein